MNKQNSDSMEAREEKQEHEDNKQQLMEKDEEIVEVVDTKPCNMVFNREEMMKIYEDVPDDEETPNYKSTKLKQKKPSFKKKTSGSKNEAAKKQSEMSKYKEKVMAEIEPLMKRYKSTNSPLPSDTELNKLKFEGKEKIFRYMLYNVYELKDICYIRDLNEQEKQIFHMNQIDVYNHCKNIANSISAYFISHLNQNNKITASKRFKSQWKKLLSNIQDENNYEFRIKIATNKWTPETLAEADETEFYPQAKREFIMQRNKRLINASTVEEKFVMPFEEQQNYEAKFEIGEKGEERRNKKKEYVEESTIKMLKQFLSKEHLVKMKESIEENIKKNEKLVANMEHIFRLQ